MEQHRARTPQHSPPRKSRPAGAQDARLPRPAEAVAPPPGETSTVYRVRQKRRGPLAPLAAAVRRLPRPRLTGLGCGLLATLALLAFACLDALLFGGAPTAYGVFFLLVSAGAALWVRPYDLITAPVALPIAYTVGLFPISPSTGGLGGLLMGVFTVLATHAGYLYAGTLLCALLTLARKAALTARRRALREAANRPARRPERRPAPRRQPTSPAARTPQRRERPSRPPQSPRCSEAAQARSRP